MPERLTLTDLTAGADERRQEPAVPDDMDALRARLADLSRPRFHTWCGETHVPGPCADGILRPSAADEKATSGD